MNWKTLLWWLGPWCNQQKAPKIVASEDFTVSTEPSDFRFRVYSGSVRNGAVLVLPGLHPDGLDDDRMDRFCKVLARSGAVVGVPELPTMMQSVMVPQLCDTEAAACFTSYLSKYTRRVLVCFVFPHLQSLVYWLHMPSGLLSLYDCIYLWPIDGIPAICDDWLRTQRRSTRATVDRSIVFAGGLYEFDAFVWIL